MHGESPKIVRDILCCSTGINSLANLEKEEMSTDESFNANRNSSARKKKLKNLNSTFSKLFNGMEILNDNGFVVTNRHRVITSGDKYFISFCQQLERRKNS